MKPTTRKRKHTEHVTNHSPLARAIAGTYERPARKRTGWNDTPFQQDEEREAEMRSGVKRPTRKRTLPHLVTLEEKLTLLIAIWRSRLRVGVHSDARRCVDELEKLFSHE